MAVIASVIAANRIAILSEVFAKVRERPNAAGLSEAELMGTLWEYLEAVAQYCGDGSDDWKRRANRLAAAHVALRRHTGFDLEVVSGEFGTLARLVSSAWVPKPKVEQPAFQETSRFFDIITDAQHAATEAYLGQTDERRKVEQLALRRLDDALALERLDMSPSASLAERLAPPLDTIRILLGAASAALYLADEKGESVFHCAVTGGFDAPEAGTIPLQDGSFLAQVCRSEQAVQICDAVAAEANVRLGLPANLRTIIGVKLWPNGQLMGALMLGRSWVEPFSPQAQTLLALVAEYLSTIVDRARLFGEVRQTQEELRQKNVLYGSILDAQADLGEGLAIIHAGKVKFINQAYADMFGVPVSELTTQDQMLQFVPAEDREELRRRFLHLLDGDTPTHKDDVHVVRENGERLIMEASVKRMPDGAFVALARDVTQQRTLAHEEHERREFIEQLIGVVSHDLRNPLAAAMVTASAMQKRGIRDPRDQIAVERILTCIRRASRLIRDLLDFTSARVGPGIPLAKRPLDLEHLARTVIDEVQAAWPDRHITLEVRGRPEGYWDGDRLAQVLVNLLANALEYSPPNSEVQVLCDASEGPVRISVRNHGKPIPSGLMPFLFDPLTRGGQRSSRGNLGLGLYIVREIVRAHGGEVWVNSDTEQGTAFTVTLPRVQESESTLQLQ